VEQPQAGVVVSEKAAELFCSFVFFIALIIVSWFDSEIGDMDLKNIKLLYFEYSTGIVAQLNKLVEKTENSVVKAVRGSQTECMFSLIFDSEAQVAPYVKKIESLNFKIKELKHSHCPDGYYVTFTISGWAE
tara:strand:- start:1281 stop:1676 length:396 start_codon:yes stop_codon:yes gene_type:complete